MKISHPKGSSSGSSSGSQVPRCHVPLRILLAWTILFLSISSHAQKIHGSTGFHIPRDNIRLKNKDSETGKIIYSDSSRIILQKYDYSEKNILWNDIDTVTGLSWFTYFYSQSFGYNHWNGFISQRLHTFSSDAGNFNMKFGYMRKKHFAANIDLGYQGGQSHRLFHAGVGIRRYIFSDYVKKKNFYLGLNFGYNFPLTNMNRFFDLGWCAGYEYLLQEKYRLFLEYDKGGAQKYEPHPGYFSFNAGIRISMEYEKYYRRLNN